MSINLTYGNGWGDAGNSSTNTTGGGQSVCDAYRGDGHQDAPFGDGRGTPFHNGAIGPQAFETRGPLCPPLLKAPTTIGLVVEDHNDLQTSVMLAALNVRRYR